MLLASAAGAKVKVAVSEARAATWWELTVIVVGAEEVVAPAAAAAFTSWLTSKGTLVVDSK